MTTPTLETFRARYPEFAGVDDALVTLILGEAAQDISDLWPDAHRATAIMLAAAHTIAAEGGAKRSGGAVAGPITSRKVGDVQTSYGAVAGATGSAAEEGSTQYGRRLAQMRADLFAGQFRAV